MRGTRWFRPVVGGLAALVLLALALYCLDQLQQAQ